MDALNKLLTFLAIILLLLFGALFVVNLDSARAVGVETERFIADTLQLARHCMIGVMAFGALTGLTALGIWIAKRRNENMRSINGKFPLQQMKVNGATVWIDVNRMMTPAMVVSRTGIAEVFTADPQVYLQHNLALTRVSVAQALAPGDNAIASRYGSQFRWPGSRASDRQLIDGKATQKLLPEPKTVEPDVVPATVRMLPVEEALMQNHRTQLVVGQTDDAEIVRWNMPETPHIRVHGSSQAAGKTNLIRCVATNALRVGHHVIVCDRRRFKDWAEFTDKAEFIDTKNPTAFAKVARRLQEIYQERDAELGRHGAPNIMRLATPPQRIVVVVSEFGALCDQAKADGVLDDMLHPLSMVLREAGATGVHVVIEDQFVSDKWPKGISTNAEPMCGRLPQNYGAAGGYWRADKLRPYTFHYNGTIFRALDMRSAVPQAIATVRKAEPIIDAEYRVVRGGGESTPTSGEGATNTLHEGATNGAANIPTNKAGWYEWMLTEYFPTHPELLSTDAQGRGIGIMPLARAMALLARGDEGEAGSYQGIASEIAQKLRKNFTVKGKQV